MMNIDSCFLVDILVAWLVITLVVTAQVVVDGFIVVPGYRPCRHPVTSTSLHLLDPTNQYEVGFSCPTTTDIASRSPAIRHLQQVNRRSHGNCYDNSKRTLKQSTTLHAFFWQNRSSEKQPPPPNNDSSSSTKNDGTSKSENNDSPKKDILFPLSNRRDVLIQAAKTSSTAAAAAVAGAAGVSGADNVKLSSSSTSLVADIPMIRLRLPNGGIGREYVAIQLKIQGQGPFDFMIDSGLTTEMITPHLQQSLGISRRQGRSGMQGIGAGGSTNTNELIELNGASLCCGIANGSTNNEVPLPSLSAVITDFPQEHVDPLHNVEGMIGMELLSRFDVDFDFPANRFRLWQPGTCTATTSTNVFNNLVEIPAVTINETGLIGIRITATDEGSNAKQPIIGFLDCGSTFTVVNWAAAKYLGLPTNRQDPVYTNGPQVVAIGIDGQPMQLSIVPKQLTFAGDIVKDSKSGKPVGFQSAPESWKPWDQVQLAVGDLPAFASLLSLDGIQPYTGPAALIGLDILSQRRIILGAQNQSSRKRRVFVG